MVTDLHLFACSCRSSQPAINSSSAQCDLQCRKVTSAHDDAHEDDRSEAYLRASAMSTRMRDCLSRNALENPSEKLPTHSVRSRRSFKQLMIKSMSARILCVKSQVHDGNHTLVGHCVRAQCSARGTQPRQRILPMPADHLQTASFGCHQVAACLSGQAPPSTFQQLHASMNKCAAGMCAAHRCAFANTIRSSPQEIHQRVHLVNRPTSVPASAQNPTLFCAKSTLLDSTEHTCSQWWRKRQRMRRYDEEEHAEERKEEEGQEEEEGRRRAYPISFWSVRVCFHAEFDAVVEVDHAPNRNALPRQTLMSVLPL